MKRLINADDMIKSLMDMTFYDEEGHIIDDYEERLAIVKSFVDSVPTVEAQPVRHGRWVRDEFGTRCGACGLYAYRDKFDQPWESPYCPNCGAKMDGEQEKQEKEKAFWSRYLLKPCAEEEEEQNDQTD